MTEPFQDTQGGSVVSGFLHTPEKPNNNGLVLTHGAGSDCRAVLLVEAAKAFADTGMFVLRCDLAFRQKRRSGPPHPSTAAEDRNSLRAALTALRSKVSGHVFAGGHSYGGRQASMLAAEDPTVAEALLLLSYPLHPPEKPAQLRTAHFRDLKTPALFVHGTKDPFATPEELGSALSLIPAATRLEVIEGAGHDLKRGKIDFANRVLAAWRELRVAAILD